MRFGIFYEHQLPRPWAPDSERTLFENFEGDLTVALRLGEMFGQRSRF